MENLTPDEAELLALINYHQNYYQNTKTKQEGLNSDEDIYIIEVFNQAQQMLQNISQTRKNEYQQQQLQKQIPKLVQCPQCKTQKINMPIGEAKSKQGYMCTNFYCNKCNIEFLEDAPNNPKDQVKYLETILSTFQKNKALVKKNPQLNQVVAQLKAQTQSFKDAYKIELEAQKKVIETQQLQQQAIIQLRDYLLVAKIKNQSPNTPMGTS